ncbi:hypothetical protein SAMN05421748_107348 [Paractinoplanes atraurantiacus]|uniref:Uncharacterized protein n=1 Tax=Paractinoplanes atraurantiacus TaxID=1036182 RepID=A0A285IDH9_9ACTN|nr:hypothetical protein SAMN05421748_107348 [Actinoplanes atraurantiacus]
MSLIRLLALVLLLSALLGVGRSAAVTLAPGQSSIEIESTRSG